MTIASLMAAVSMMVGVSVMIHSFRETVIEWVDQVMVADLFITPAANESLGMVATLPDHLTETLSTLPNVSDSATYREFSVTPPDGSRPFSLAISEGRAQVHLIEGNQEDALPQWKSSANDLIIVNEPYANRFQAALGDSVALLTPKGEREFTIVGISRDYAKDIGQVVLHRSTYAKYWDDPAIQSLALFLNDSVTDNQLGELKDEIRALAPDTPLAIHTSRSLREEVLVIFDQTFAVTYVLRIIAIFVAIVGVILGLTTLVRERTREIGVLRAIGSSPKQIKNTYLCEAGLIGFWSAAIGLVCGLCLALILTHIVNPAFFGWTIDLRVPLLELALIPLWLPLIAALAGAAPATRAAKTEPAAAIREE